MDLVERYLAAVGRELPETQRADLTAELRDELLSTIEDREASLGRPLAPRELEALLVEFGHPLAVAHRYRKIQHLVGPAVFPFWWAGMKAALAVGAGVYVVLAVVSLLGGGDLHRVLARVVPNLWDAFLTVFAVVTLVAILIEQSGGMARLARLRPTQLPPSRLKTRSRFDHVVEIGCGLVFILWWVGALRFPELSRGGLEAAATWDLWHAPVLVYLVFELFSNALSFLRPAWVRVNATLRLMRNVAGAGLLAGILQTGPWIRVTDPAAHSLGDAEINGWVEAGLQAGLVLMLVLSVQAAWRLAQSLGRGDGPDGAFRPAS